MERIKTTTAVMTQVNRDERFMSFLVGTDDYVSFSFENVQFRSENPAVFHFEHTR